MREDDPLLPLAEYLSQEHTFYASGEFMTPRELGIVKWAMLYALNAAQAEGWRFEHE